MMKIPGCIKAVKESRRGIIKDFEPEENDTSIADIINDKNATEKLVNLAKEIGVLIGRDLRNVDGKDERLSTSQLRTVFGEVKRLQMRFDYRRLLLLKPKLHYMATKHGLGAKALRTVLERGIDEVKSSEEKFSRFVEFFEAILCYVEKKEVQ